MKDLVLVCCIYLVGVYTGLALPDLMRAIP